MDEDERQIDGFGTILHPLQDAVADRDEEITRLKAERDSWREESMRSEERAGRRAAERDAIREATALRLELADAAMEWSELLYRQPLASERQSFWAWRNKTEKLRDKMAALTKQIKGE